MVIAKSKQDDIFVGTLNVDRREGSSWLNMFVASFARRWVREQYQLSRMKVIPCFSCWECGSLRRDMLRDRKVSISMRRPTIVFSLVKRTDYPLRMEK